MSVKPCKVMSYGDASDSVSPYTSEDEESNDMLSEGDSTADQRINEKLSSPSQATPTDVYIGRGNKEFIEKNHGLYMKLIKEHTKGYFDAPMGIKKMFIMEEIVNEIRRQGGNFYTNQYTRDYDVWKIASEESVVRKIKLAIMNESMKEKGEEREKLNASHVGAKRSSSDTINHSKNRPYPTILNTSRLNMNIPNGIPNSMVNSMHNNHLLDAIHAQAKAFARPVQPERQMATRKPLAYQSPPVATPNATNMPVKRTLYINERTGHLLNVNSCENDIYHDLLIRHAHSFQQHFGSRDIRSKNMWNDDGRVRFVWDNIVSELQRSESFHIVLCPDSQKSIDVDPKDLQHIDRNVTFRTIRSIIAALSDRRYVESELAAKQQKLQTTRRLSGDAVEMKMRQLCAQTMQQSLQQEGQIPVIQWQQPQQSQLPAFVARQQDPVLVSNGSCATDPTPETDNDATVAAIVAAAQLVQNEETIKKFQEDQVLGAARDLVRSKLRNLQGLGEMASAVLSQDRQIQIEKERQLQVERQLRNAVNAIPNRIQPSMSDMRTNMLQTYAAHVQRTKAMEALRAAEAAASAHQNLELSAPTPSNDPSNSPYTGLGQIYALQSRNTMGIAITPRQWNSRYTALLEYYVEHGTFEVPETYNDEPNLFQFVQSVRHLRREKKRGVKGRFYDKWEKLLDKIGFLWEPPRGSAAPNGSEREQRKTDCALLREFGRTHPDIRVLLKSPRFAWFDKWVNDRKAKAEKSKKEFDEESLMELFGFEWEHPPSETSNTSQREEEASSTVVKSQHGMKPTQAETLLRRKRKLSDLNNTSDHDIVI